MSAVPTRWITRTGTLFLAYTALFGLIVLIAALLLENRWGELSARMAHEALTEQSNGLNQVLREKGRAGLVEEIDTRIASRLDPEALYALWSEDGQLIAGNVSPQLDFPERGFQTVELSLMQQDTEGGGEHAAIAQVWRLADRSTLLVGRDVQAQRTLRSSTLALVRMTLAAIGLAGLVGAWFIGRWVLHRIDGVTRTTRQISHGDIRSRVPVDGSGDEFDQLAEAINQMLARIESLTAGMQSVIDSVAHDLRRPLTHARQTLDAALRADLEERPELAEVGESLDQIQRTLTALLHIVQADAGANANRMERCAIDRLVLDVAELMEPMASARGIELVVKTAPMAAMAHRQLLAQAVLNLIDNAIKYAPDGKAIEVTLARDNDRLRITVRDRGPGIPPDQRERAVERFVRLHESPGLHGNGLGLSLAASVARLHGGELQLSDANPGLCASLILPVIVEADIG